MNDFKQTNDWQASKRQKTNRTEETHDDSNTNFGSKASLFTRIQTLAVKPRYSQWIRSERLPRIMKLKILLDHFMA